MIKSLHTLITQCKELGTETAENWYSHIPKSVWKQEDVTVQWNQGVQTDGHRFWQISQTRVSTKEIELAYWKM
jgi:hypothetical protein